MADSASNGGDDRSMSEILASIRKIVTEEERARHKVEQRKREEDGDEDVLVLTGAMRVETDPEAPSGGAFELTRARMTAPASLDLAREADIESIVRRVMREELKGPIGVEISRKVKAAIHKEVRRALEDDEPLI